MLRGIDVRDIHELRRQGLSISAISGLTGFDRKTIRKYLAQGEITPRVAPRPQRSSKLDPFKEYIEERLQAGVWDAIVLLREVRARGYGGGYTILKDYLRPKRRFAGEVAVRRFETPPGHQAQVDWGHVGTQEWRDGETQTLSGFVFTLGHSRAVFADVATDQTLGTLLALHEAAFQELGGVPQEILYDWMKTVVLGVDERGEPRWHPVFSDFAAYWGFTPRLCRTYRPQTKGKVESGVKYLRGNFLCGRQATSLDDLRAQLREWTRETANRRVHGTTGKIIWDAWQAERPHLRPVGSRPSFPHIPHQVRKVSRDAYVSYRGNRYSVPWTYAGQEVLVRCQGDRVEIYRDEERIAIHTLGAARHEAFTVSEHHAGIPFAPTHRASRGKTKIHIRVETPEVEQRPLAAYQALAEEGHVEEGEAS